MLPCGSWVLDRPRSSRQLPKRMSKCLIGWFPCCFKLSGSQSKLCVIEVFLTSVEPAIFIRKQNTELNNRICWAPGTVFPSGKMVRSFLFGINCYHNDWWCFQNQNSCYIFILYRALLLPACCWNSRDSYTFCQANLPCLFRLSVLSSLFVSSVLYQFQP